MRRAMVLAAVALLCGAAAGWADVHPAVLEAEQQRIAVMDKVKDSVLAIFASSGAGGGSGVVISPDGFALTNFHVVKPCGNAMKCGMADGKVYDAVVVGLDPTGDVALIKLFGRDDFPYAQLGDSDALRVGDACFAMGNPFLLATNFQPTVTFGMVSGTHRYQPPAGTILEYADCIQTDASINPGNSGGPLFDAAGRLVGINGRGSFEKRGRVNVGVAYAISINQIKNFMGCLHSGRIVDHATLGAVVSTDEEGRVVVTNILENSDAYRRGLRYGDEIVAFGGRPIATANAFKNALGIFPKGWRVPLSFRRDGRRYDVLVRLAGVHSKEELLEKTEGGPRPVPMPIPKPGDKPPRGDKPVPGPQPPGQPKPIPIPIPNLPEKPGETSAGLLYDVAQQPVFFLGANNSRTAAAVLVAAEERPHSGAERDNPNKERSGDDPSGSAEGKQPSDQPPRKASEERSEGKKGEGGKSGEGNSEEKKSPEKVKEPPKGAPPVPVPLPMGPPPMPEHLKKYFEAKRGFANYYFNRQQQQRVLGSWQKRCDLKQMKGKWSIAGQLPTGRSFAFEVDDNGGVFKLAANKQLGLPPSEIPWTATDNLGVVLAPVNSGGLLPTLYVLRKLAIEGPERCDEAYYFGTAPLLWQGELMDVVCTLYRKVECMFYFHPSTGDLMGVEMFPEEHADPCEVYFSEYQQVDGRWLPGKMEVRYGDDPYGTFLSLQWTFQPQAASPEGAKPADNNGPKPTEGKPSQ